LIGVALLVEPHGSDQTKLGTVAGLSSAASYALFWRANQKASQRLRLAQLSLGQNIAVLGLLAPILIFVGPAPSGTTAWTLLMALGVFNTAGMLLYAFALKHISASTCSGFVALEPVYAIAFAALLFKEPLTGWMAVSLILIVGASLALLKLEQPPSPT
jgi:drug/metabolite transporter (DMT)-like permease